MNYSTKTILISVGIVTIIALLGLNFFGKKFQRPGSADAASKQEEKMYLPPDTSQFNALPQAGLIRFGRDLVANTKKYLGPDGTVAHISNKLNCQSCHLEAGAKAAPYSANFLGVAANYPMYRHRSGIMESVEFRVNDCMMRSMNGKPLDSNSREMKAIVAYILWLGKEVPPKIKPLNSAIEQIPYLDRPADSATGQKVYVAKCQLCHSKDGQGGMSVDSVSYYPPLWGADSYNTGAGMYRMTRLAGFVKNNMPFGVNHGQTLLTDEEAWDVAAFINSQPRPHKDFPNDWPDLSKKAIDHPFGPYADNFSEQQHKYGPFGPIEKEFNKRNNQKKIKNIQMKTGHRFFIAIMVCSILLHPFRSHAQNDKYNVVFDLTSGDTTDHQSLLRWLNGISAGNPNAKMEVVLYGLSLSMVAKGRSTVADEVQKLAMNKNISFMVCEQAMKRHQLQKTDLLAGVGTVQDGIAEIVQKQKEGWGYIKAGR